MSSTLATVTLFAILFASQVAVTLWVTGSVLELTSKRPLGAAVATLLLTGLTVGPAVAGFDALIGHSVSSFSRLLLVALVGVVQTGLVLRLIYRTSVPLALAHSLILQMTWAAMSVVVLLCARLGGLYAASPLVLFVAAYVTKRLQDRELTRVLGSIPPTAPNLPVVAQR